MALSPDDQMRACRPNGMNHHGLVSTPPGCTRCPLRKKPKVYPDGPVPSRMALVGDFPDAQAVHAGRTHVGPAGDLLWNQLGPACGFQRGDIWATNALLCKPSSVRLDNGAWLPEKTVTALALDCCRERLLHELITVDPLVIIPVGNHALKAVTNIANAKVYAYRGAIMETDLRRVLVEG